MQVKWTCLTLQVMALEVKVSGAENLKTSSIRHFDMTVRTQSAWPMRDPIQTDHSSSLLLHHRYTIYYKQLVITLFMPIFIYKK